MIASTPYGHPIWLKLKPTSLILTSCSPRSLTTRRTPHLPNSGSTPHHNLVLPARGGESSLMDYQSHPIQTLIESEPKESHRTGYVPAIRRKRSQIKSACQLEQSKLKLDLIMPKTGICTLNLLQIYFFLTVFAWPLTRTNSRSPSSLRCTSKAASKQYV